MVATRLCLFSLLSLLSALRTPSRSQIPRTVLHSRRGILGGVLAGVTSLSVTGRIPESRADSTGGIAESRLVRSLSDLQKLDGSIVAHQYRQAREELREGALAHLREDVREAMAYHPVSEAKAKATIDALVNLDNVLRRAERGQEGSQGIFPALLKAVDNLREVTTLLDKDGSLYGEDFTNPAPFQKRWAPRPRS